MPDTSPALASLALNRFGLGARPDEAVPVQQKAWLIDQFAAYQPRPPALAAIPTSAAVAAELAEYRDQQRQARQQSGTPARRAAMVPAMPGTADPAPIAANPDDPVKQARQFARRQARDDYGALVGARAAAAFTTPAPFVERLVHFWANHFAISVDKLTVVGLGGTLEMEAIRPHVLGRFADMLNAVERHPAMLLYLDQAQSVGPNSPLGSRVAARGAMNGNDRKVGLNENLAREILELHTLGVRTGYTQADVTEFARAMTGWTVAGIGRGPGARLAGTANGEAGDFVFAPALHEPGARTIMGRTYPAAGEAQAQAVLADLAASPATATHLATKLARHFAGDTPPPAMVERLQAAYLSSER